MQALLTEMLSEVIGSLMHNWIPLGLAMIIAAIMQVYIDPEKLKETFIRRSNASIVGSVALGAFTPLCACGTMAVIIGMLTTALPWGPIMAFLVSSPLMSPDAFVMLSGIISFKFAVALTVASIVIGLASGYLTHVIEKRTGFLKDQVRFSKQGDPHACDCEQAAPPVSVQGCSCANRSVASLHGARALALCCAGQGESELGKFYYSPMLGMTPAVELDLTMFTNVLKKIRWQELRDAMLRVGVRQILLYYAIFVGVGFLVSRFVPTSLIVALFSGNNPFAVPLAALVGLPIYVSGESAIPLIKSLMAGGASGGSMLAFMITGPGTSAWVIAGIATIMKRRAMTLYVLFILAGGIVLGYLYDLMLAMGV